MSNNFWLSQLWGLVIPCLAFGVAGRAVVAGKIRPRGGPTYYRSDEPIGFWIYVGILLLIGCVFCGVIAFNYWAARSQHLLQGTAPTISAF